MKISQELMFPDTNVPLVLIGSTGYNLQYKPFCDWLTLLNEKRHPSTVSVIPSITQVLTFGDKRYLRLIERQCKSTFYTWLCLNGNSKLISICRVPKLSV